MSTQRSRLITAVASAMLLAAGAAGLDAAIALTDAVITKVAIHPPGGLRYHTIPVRSETWERFGADPPPLSAEIIENLGTENYISRYYIKSSTRQDPRPRIFELHCTYFTGMSDTVPHVPETCFVGGGMRIVNEAVIVPVPIDIGRFPPDPTLEDSEFDPAVFGVIRRGRTGPDSDTPGVRVRMPFGLDRLRLRVTEFESPDGRRTFAGYFFLANGWAVDSALGVRLRAFDLKARHAYYSKVQFTSSLVDSAEELAEIAADFLNEMLPEIMRRVPDWTEVAAGRYPE